jgi:6-pyruvoyltetrahydropterin/6-carboxytetrahydropterin synthase
MISVTREHEICAGHRVLGHEGKCKNLHGHNYKFVMTLVSDDLDTLGRVIDFSVIKNILCQWLEDNWDHKMLLWLKDPMAGYLRNCYQFGIDPLTWVVSLSCNPTAENLAQYFCEDIASGLLLGTNVKLVEVTVWETSKCYATYKVKEENVATDGNGRGNVEASQSRVEENV